MNVMDWRFWVPIISTVVFGITTIVLAFRLAKKRQPVWAYKTTKIIGLGSNAPPELKLTFNEQSVSDVYQTRGILFNKGNEAILKDNVTESILIHFKEADILRPPVILAKSREGIAVSAKQVGKDGDNAIEVSFQYLDHNDGAVIEVLHTRSQAIEASGNIIGTSGIRYIGEFAPTFDRQLRVTVVRVMMVLAMVSIFSWAFVKEPPKNLPLGTLGNTIFYILGLVVLLFMLEPEVAPFIRSRKFPRWSVIKS